MNLETLRAYCLSLPYVAENVQWDEHLVFRIEEPSAKPKAKNTPRGKVAPKGKIFCIANLGPEGARVTFKCTPENFAELVEVPDIAPAAYLARNHWVSVESWEALNNEEFRQYVRHSYDLVWEKLPKSTRQRLTEVSDGKKQIMKKRAKPAKRKSAAKAKSKTRRKI